VSFELGDSALMGEDSAAPALAGREDRTF